LFACCCNLLARLLVAAGKERDIMKKIMRQAHVMIPHCIQDCWIRQHQIRGFAVSLTNTGRASTKLNKKHKKLVKGFVYSHIQNHKPLNNKQVHSFITRVLGVPFSLSSTQVLTKQLGFSTFKQRFQTGGFSRLPAERAKLMFNFLKKVLPLFKWRP